MKKLKKIMSLLLALVMVFSFAPVSVFAQEGETEPSPLSWEVIENNTQRMTDKLKTVKGQEEASEVLTGDVRVSIVLDAPSTLEKGYSAQGVALDPSAVDYRQSLKNTQDEMAAKISREVLGGASLDVVWNLTLAANIISANVPAEKIAEIRDIVGVKDVVVETRYEPQEADASDEPNMSVATGMTNAQYAWAAGYNGAGSKVAIVDTGLDYHHQSFDPVAFEVAIMQDRAAGRDIDLLTASDVSKFWPSLNASQKTSGGPENAYFNAKVPYGFNYVDRGFDIEHVNDTQEEHGSHVASIAAANRFIYRTSDDGSITFKNAITEVRTQGNAPDAQLLIMKVFGKGGGAYDSDYFSAIEDAIVLGADSVNLSLGSASKGFTYNSTYQEIIDGLKDVNIIWCNSAGNNGSWADETVTGYLYSDAANLATGGSPATYESTISVASVDNDGFTGAYFEFGNDLIFYTETSGYGNPPMTSIAGTYEFVYIDGPGVDDNTHVGKAGDQFLALGSEAVKGKIAVCNRGTSSFFAKANAAKAQGAVGVIIANNQPGTISMNLTDYVGGAPVVSITQADGELLKNGSEAHDFEGSGQSFTYYTGSIVVGNTMGTTNYNSDYYTMSSFSSFGVPESLDLKPEITAPGGNIYAVNGLARTSSGMTGGHDQYENMSGTSMASPQMAGIVGTMAQYYRESGFAERTAAMGLSQRQALQSLLMSTATPLIEGDSGSYYSVMKQGSGLANLEAAVNSRTLILMNSTAVGGEVRKDISDDAADGKVKAELGDDPGRIGSYSVEFRLLNISDDRIVYDLDADFFTQDIFAYYTLDEAGNNIVNEDGTPVVSTYLDTWTAPLGAVSTWYLNGTQFDPYPEKLEYDVNADGYFDENDAQAILDHIAGPENNQVFVADKADFDGDGEITSRDAYLALELANEEPHALPVQIAVDGMAEATVRLEVSIPELADYDDNGAYVEGYIFAKESQTEDGAEGVELSIPVIGYYGNWTEPSFIDVGSAIEYEYGLEQRYPYMAAPLGKDVLNSQYFTGTHATLAQKYILGGNPVVSDTEYRSERNAINSRTVLEGAAYSQIRNSVGYRYVVYDAEGEVVRETAQRSNVYSAYYHQNQAKWMNTATSTGFGYRPTDFEDGDAMILGFYLAPEYYQDHETGAIDWSMVYPSMMMAFTVDDNAPELTSVFGARMEDQALVTVSARDNGYIAAFFVYDEDGTLIYEKGAREDAKASPDTFDRQDYIVTVEGSTVSDHLEVEVWDYAANVTTARINLNKDEFDDPVEVRLSDSSVTSVVGNSFKLSAVVYPWGYDDQRVLWTSSDETIATVDENGVVTGVAEGSAIITATSVADPSGSADCEVTFMVIDRDLRGLVWDEEGAVWFSEFNTGTLPEYEKLTEEDAHLELASAAYAKNGNFYAATFDSSKLLSDLYIVNDQTFEATQVGGSDEIAYMDLAPANRLGRNFLMGVYGPYVVIVDVTTGDYEGAFDFSEYTGGAELVGIAFEESVRTTYGYSDWYFLIDANGNLINAGFLPYQGSYANFTPTVMGNLGYSTDTFYFQSLYYDGTDLYWSRYVEAADKVDIIFVNDLYHEGSIFNLGSFADKVWPVGGLYNDAEKHLIGLNDESETEKTDVVLDDSSRFMTRIVNDPLKKAQPADGGLDSAVESVRDELDKEAVRSIDVEPQDETTYNAEITVEAADDVTYNGFYEVEFDPATVTFAGYESELSHTAYTIEADAGHFRFAFADLNGVEKGDAIFKLRFTANVEEPRTVTVKTVESNDNFDGSEEVYTIEAHIHDWNEPTYEWSDDNSEVTATRVCKDDPDHFETETAKTTSVVKTPASCDEMGTTTYTAEFKNEAFTTQTKDVQDIPALGHLWKEPEWTWANDLRSATAHFVCEHNEEHFCDLKDEDIEVVDRTDSTIIYEACVELDGVEYKDTMTVENTVRVIAYPEDVLGDAYVVSGGMLVVNFDAPCKVGYMVDGEYVALSQHNQAVGEEGTSHIFLIPAGVDELILVVKGDADGDGEFTDFDVIMAKATALGRMEPDDVQRFAMDVDDDGEFNDFDTIMMKAVALGKMEFDWFWL